MDRIILIFRYHMGVFYLTIEVLLIIFPLYLFDVCFLDNIIFRDKL